MSDFELKRVENQRERDLITFLIVSDKICNELLQYVKLNYIKSKYARTILLWIKEYWIKYQEAPKKNIERIFVIKKDSLKNDEAELIEEFLLNLSKEYEKLYDLNYTFLLKELKEYVGTVTLKTNIDKAENFLEEGDFEKARNCFSDSVDYAHEFMYDDFNPLTLKQVIKHYKYGNSNKMFDFSGTLGELIGTLEYGWFVGILAPLKRGKSWLLLETAIQSVLNGHNTLFFSLEMREQDIRERIYKRFVSAASEEGEYKYPIFDCWLNQSGACTKRERKNRITLLDEDNKKPEYSKDLKYKVCTACRGTSEFRPASWFTTIERPALNVYNVKRKIRQFELMFGDKLIVKIFPRFGASVSDIEAYVNYLRINRNYVPSTIIIDYADILRSEYNDMSVRAQMDSIYKRLGGMAMDYNSLVVTASQATRKSIGSISLRQEDISEDIRKLAHLDVCIGINQTRREKREKVMRLNVLGHRHKNFDPSVQALCLTNFSTGSVIIDSEKVTFFS